jgi:hypothetical protein
MFVVRVVFLYLCINTFLLTFLVDVAIAPPQGRQKSRAWQRRLSAEPFFRTRQQYLSDKGSIVNHRRKKVKKSSWKGNTI